MKKIITLAAAAFFLQFAGAQINHIPTTKQIRDYLNKRKLSIELSDSNRVIGLPADTARYIHSTAEGDVYRLSPDGMPCLRPDSSRYVQNMPLKPFIYRQKPATVFSDSSGIHIYPPAYNGQMPNAYRGRPLVWQQKPDDSKP